MIGGGSGASPLGAESLAADAAPGRWRMLTLLATAELLGMSLWFVASALSTQLRAVWDLSPAETGWLTSVVQLGFVAGTAAAAVLNLADVVPSRWYFAVSAILGAAANAALLAADGYRSALALRFATGFCLAGVYPPAMKMIATWFRADRGLAIGGIVAALTVGKSLPYLVRALEGAGVAPVVWTASGAAILAAIVVAAGYREGPFPFPRRPFAWGLVATVARHRETRLATSAYLGHMWELYAMWTWIPAFLAAVAARRAGMGNPGAGGGGFDALPVDGVAFAVIAVGGLGCLWGGWAARRIGYRRVVTISLVLSGASSIAIGLLFDGPWWLVVGVAAIWGFFVIADSAQYSAIVTEVAPAHAVGTALTLQTSLGFLLSMVTIQLTPLLVEVVGWPWAFAVLSLGPVAGIAAIRRL